MVSNAGRETGGPFEIRHWSRDERLGLAAVNAVIWGAWGFLGFGVLRAPGVFFLTVVAPCTLLAGRRFGTEAFARSPFCWQVFNGAMLAAGFAAKQVAAILLYQ